MRITIPDVEDLAERMHDIEQKEARRRRGDVAHVFVYANESEETKEWYRVYARWVLTHWQPRFNAEYGIPEA